MNLLNKYKKVIEYKNKNSLIIYANNIKWLYKKCNEALDRGESCIILDYINLERIAIIQRLGFKTSNGYASLDVELNEKSLMQLENEYLKIKDVQEELIDYER